MPPLSFYVDVSLGRRAIPQMVRDLGYEVRHKEDFFGHRRVADVEWITEADQHDWIALCKDDRIRSRPMERRVLAASGLRVFCLTSGNLRRDEQVRRFRENWPRIVRQAEAEAGPWVFGVYADRIEQLQIFGERG